MPIRPLCTVMGWEEDLKKVLWMHSQDRWVQYNATIDRHKQPACCLNQEWPLLPWSPEEKQVECLQERIRTGD